MLRLVLRTKLRRRLFTYFFTHLEGSYYVREIASIINEDAGNLSRELCKLEKEGLYKSSLRGRLKFYSLNKNYPLFNELKNIISKTVDEEGNLKALASCK